MGEEGLQQQFLRRGEEGNDDLEEEGFLKGKEESFDILQASKHQDTVQNYFDSLKHFTFADFAILTNSACFTAPTKAISFALFTQ